MPVFYFYYYATHQADECMKFRFWARDNSKNLFTKRKENIPKCENAKCWSGTIVIELNWPRNVKLIYLWWDRIESGFRHPMHQKAEWCWSHHSNLYTKHFLFSAREILRATKEVEHTHPFIHLLFIVSKSEFVNRGTWKLHENIG